MSKINIKGSSDRECLPLKLALKTRQRAADAFASDAGRGQCAEAAADDEMLNTG